MSHHRWQAGECLVDLQRQVLLRHGGDVPVRPKAWALLVALLERPNAVVPARQLLDRLWPRQSVDPKVLVNIASELRACLGDPAALRCVPRRGYLVVAAPVRAESPAQLAPGPSVSPFVGRENELRLLDDWAAGAAGRGPQVLRIRGVAGVGKTSLLEHWLNKVSASGRWNLLVGRALDMVGEQEPFGPVLQMLAERARAPDGADFVADLATYAPCWLAQLPQLVARAEHSRLVPPLAGAGTGRMVREGVELIIRWASRQPTLLVVEDIHWIDTASADLLAQLLRATACGQLFIVFTSRPPQGSGHPASDAARLLDRDRESRSVEIELDRLSPRSVCEYLSLRLPGLKVDDGMLHAIDRWTEGSPLFLRALVDGMQAREPGSLGVVTELQGSASTPASLQDFVRSRVGLLGPEKRAVLEALSCLATMAPAALLAAVLDLPPARVEHDCEWLTRRGFLVRSAGLLALSDETLEVGYGFTHEVYRRAIQEALPPRLRRTLNRRLAGALLRGGADRSSALAAHLVLAYANAGMPLEAAQALRVASSRSLSRYAPRHAVRALLRAIRHLEAAGADPAAQSLRLEICWELTGLVPFDAMSANPELELAWKGILQTAGPVGTPRARFIRAATECAMHINQGRVDLARPAVQSLLEATPLLGSSEQAVGALWHGMALGTSGCFAEALAAFRRTGQLAQASTPPNASAAFLAAFCRVWLLALSGRLAEFEAELRAFDVQLQRREIPHFSAIGLFWTAEALRQLSCTSAAARRYRAVLDVCETHDVGLHLREARLGLQACTEPAARDLDALRVLAADPARKTPAWSDASVALVTAEALLASGRHAEAAATLAPLEGIQDRWPILWTEALRLQAGCLAQAGRHARARDLMHRAVAEDIEGGYLPGLLKAWGLAPDLDAALQSRLRAAIERAFAELPATAEAGHPDLDELRSLRSQGLAHCLPGHCST